MNSDYGVMGAVYRALVEEMGESLKVFHYVPAGIAPPYAVLELGKIGCGNGLPSPHFQTRGELKVRVWSAYEGGAELATLLGKVHTFFEGRKINLPKGSAWFEVQKVQWVTQQAQAKNLWREGCVELRFALCQ